MNESVVAVSALSPNFNSIVKALDEVLGKGGIYSAISPDTRLLLKVNCVADRLIFGATTSPIFLDALLHILKDKVRSIGVADCDDIFHSVEKGFRRTGLNKACVKHGIRPFNLTQGEFISRKMNHPPYETYFLPKVLSEYDAILSVPVMKTHSFTGMTGSIKNLYGFLEYERAMHHAYIDTILSELVQTVRPIGAVVDGIFAMDGDGPLMGTPIQLGLVMAGTNLVAIDETICQIFNFDPASIGHLKYARSVGLAPKTGITIMGDIQPYRWHRFTRPAVNLAFRVGEFAQKRPWAKRLLWGNICVWFVEKYILHLRKNILWYRCHSLPATKRMIDTDLYAKLWMEYIDAKDCMPKWDLALAPIDAPAAVQKMRRKTSLERIL